MWTPTLELPRLLSLNSCGSRKWHETAKKTGLWSGLAKVNFSVKFQPKSPHLAPTSPGEGGTASAHGAGQPLRSWSCLSLDSNGHRLVIQFGFVQKWWFLKKLWLLGLSSSSLWNCPFLACPILYPILGFDWSTPLFSPGALRLYHIGVLKCRKKAWSGVAMDFFETKISTGKHGFYPQLEWSPVDFSSTIRL